MQRTAARILDAGGLFFLILLRWVVIGRRFNSAGSAA
jgi:hypothetical protein